MNRLTIKFEEFSEENIQVIIGSVFHQKGYKIDYLHFSDRSNEDGADLIVSKGKEKIAIGVKIKPDKQDTSQLLELNDRSEKRKIYVYISTPTKKFIDFMEKCKNIEYWDLTLLNNFIFENNLYFFSNLLFREHPTIRHLEMIKYFFFGLYKKCKKLDKIKLEEMDKKSITQLWRLKDFSVVINKIPQHTLYFFEKPLIKEDKELNVHFLNLFLDFLDSLEKPTENYLGTFIKFYEKNKVLVDNSIIEMRGRSHWIYLNAFDSNIDFEKMLKSIREILIDEKKELNLLKEKMKNKEDKKIIKEIEEMSKSNSVWIAIKDWIKDLQKIGYFLEESTDDILSEYLRDYTIRYNEDWEFIH